MTSNEELRIRKLIQGATRPEKVVPLVLKAGLAREIEDLELELIELRKEGLESLAGNPKAVEIGARIDALIVEAKDSTIEVTIRGLPRKQWSDLKTKFPPDDPSMYLYDTKIFNEAVPACWVSPEIDAETRDKLLDEITDGQWERLCKAVQDVNGDVSVPFSALATRVRQASVENEQQPAPTE